MWIGTGWEYRMLGVLSPRTTRRPAYWAGPLCRPGSHVQGAEVYYVLDGRRVAERVFSKAYLSIPEG